MKHNCVRACLQQCRQVHRVQVQREVMGGGEGDGGVLGQYVLHLTSSWHFDLRPLTGVNRAPCFHNWRLLSLGF